MLSFNHIPLHEGDFIAHLPSYVCPLGIRRSFRYRSSRSKLAINLKEEIKQLIFPPTGPVCVSEDEGLFKVVMSTFYQHEQMVSLPR